MKQGQKLVSKEGYELAGYPKPTLNITQGMNGSNHHQLTKCIDDGGKDGGQENLIAPAKMVVAKVDRGNTHQVILHSVNKVKWRNGVIDYFTLGTKHANDVSDLVVGDVYEQGFVYSREGGFGKNSSGVLSPTAFGNHAHINVARGRTIVNVQKTSESSELENSVDPTELFYVNGTTIKNDGGMKWGVYDPKSIEAGSVVKTLSGTYYVSGQKVPLWVILKTHTVLRMEQNGSVALLKEINSRVYTKDLVLK